MTREEWKARLPLIQAFVDEKRVQFYSDKSGWKDAYNVSFTDPVNNYRIAPEPRLRPWTAEEVPVGALVRENRQPSFVCLITMRWEYGFAFNDLSNIRSTGFENALMGMEHSTDGGKTWLPCGVLEGEK